MDDRCIIVDRCPTVPLEEFLPDVAIHTKGAPADMAMHYIRRSANEFLRCTKVLRQMICVDLQACVCDYILEPDCDMEIVSIHKICECRELVPYRLCDDNCDGPSAWFVPPQTLTLSPAPQTDSEDGLSVLVSVAPKHDACFIHRELLDRPGYYDAIVAGALKRMLQIQGTDFFNRQLANDFKAEFNREANIASVDRLLGHGMGPVRMRSRARRYA